MTDSDACCELWSSQDVNAFNRSIIFTEEEDDGIYNSEEGAEGFKNLSSKEQLSGVGRPLQCTIMKLEANQKAKNKTERQGYGKCYILN